MLSCSPTNKDRDTNFYLRGPWAYRARSEASQNFEGGLGDANLCSSIQTDITDYRQIYVEMYTSLKTKKNLIYPKTIVALTASCLW